MKPIKLKSLLAEAASDEFTRHANEFLKRLHKLSDDYYAKHYKNLGPSKFSFAKGSKFWKVVETNDSGHKRVHSFLDTRNGDVLRAAGWKAPAKHARGNIFTNDYGMSGVNTSGANYL